jgi:hypothetical protein
VNRDEQVAQRGLYTTAERESEVARRERGVADLRWSVAQELADIDREKARRIYRERAHMAPRDEGERAAIQTEIAAALSMQVDPEKGRRVALDYLIECGFIESTARALLLYLGPENLPQAF